MAGYGFTRKTIPRDHVDEMKGQQPRMVFEGLRPSGRHVGGYKGRNNLKDTLDKFGKVKDFLNQDETQPIHPITYKAPRPTWSKLPNFASWAPNNWPSSNVRKHIEESTTPPGPNNKVDDVDSGVINKPTMNSMQQQKVKAQPSSSSSELRPNWPSSLKGHEDDAGSNMGNTSNKHEFENPKPNGGQIHNKEDEKQIPGAAFNDIIVPKEVENPHKQPNSFLQDEAISSNPSPLYRPASHQKDDYNPPTSNKATTRPNWPTQNGDSPKFHQNGNLNNGGENEKSSTNLIKPMDAPKDSSNNEDSSSNKIKESEQRPTWPNGEGQEDNKTTHIKKEESAVSGFNNNNKRSITQDSADSAPPMPMHRSAYVGNPPQATTAGIAKPNIKNGWHGYYNRTQNNWNAITPNNPHHPQLRYSGVVYPNLHPPPVYRRAAIDSKSAVEKYNGVLLSEY